MKRKASSMDQHAEVERNPAGNGAEAALLPVELLEPGEVVILMLKPSAWYILLESMGHLIGLIVLVVALVYLDRTISFPWTSHDVILFGAGLGGMRLFWQFLQWLSRVYVLTDQRILRVRGVFRVHVFETALKQIQHTQLHFSIRERLWGLGSMEFFTAGTDFPDARWQMLANPLDVHQKVLQAISRYRR